MQGLVGWVRLMVVHRGEELALASEGRRGCGGAIELRGGQPGFGNGVVSGLELHVSDGGDGGVMALRKAPSPEHVMEQAGAARFGDGGWRSWPVAAETSTQIWACVGLIRAG